MQLRVGVMQRQGTCNRCGQCCGAEGSPYQHNPWPSTWPGAFRTWQLANLIAVWPQALLFGVVDKVTGGIGPNEDVDSIRVTGPGGGMYYYVWVPGHAVCRDISAGHDGSSYSLECPFLKPDPGGGTRPCGLVGTNQDDSFRIACEGEPPEQKTVEEVAQWQLRHPLCSYTWVE